MDVRKIMYKEKMEQLEAEMTPFGFMDSASEEFEVDSDGTVWKNAESEPDYYSNWD